MLKICKKLIPNLEISTKRIEQIITNHKLHADFSHVIVVGWYYQIFQLLYTRILHKRIIQIFVYNKKIYTPNT
jgi:hypothetical protein